MKVLFVCSANAWRSPTAEALLKKNGPDMHVDSAGTYANHKVIEEVKDFLTKENAEEYVKRGSRKLRQQATQRIRHYRSHGTQT